MSHDCIGAVQSESATGENEEEAEGESDGDDSLSLGDRPRGTDPLRNACAALQTMLFAGGRDEGGR